MSEYNPYQQLHYKSLYGDKNKKSTTPKIVKMYNLFYNKQRLVHNAPYAVCNGKKSSLLKQGVYQKNYFQILPN